MPIKTYTKNLSAKRAEPEKPNLTPQGINGKITESKPIFKFQKMSNLLKG